MKKSNDKTASVEKIKSFEGRLQVLFGLFIFAPTLVTSLAALTTTSIIELNKIILQFGMFIAVSMSNYLLFEFIKSNIKEWQLYWSNLIVILNIFCFIPIIATFSVVSNHSFYGVLGTIFFNLFNLFFVSLLSLPVVLFVFFIVIASIKLNGNLKK